MIERPYTGRYIRIEGIDGSGKTTQLDMAKQYAAENDLKTLFIREPGGTEFGQEMRNYILHDKRFDFSPETEYALFTADRSHLIQTVILPALQDGYTVISDRGIESSEAYQSAAGGLPPETVRGVGELLLPSWYMQPDALVVLRVSKVVREKRIKAKHTTEVADKIESRDTAYTDRIHDAYNAIGARAYATSVSSELPPEEVFATMKPIVWPEASS